MAYLSIGSYSHGTLRAQDIAETLRDMLLSMGHKEFDAIVQELSAIAEDEGRDEEHDSEVLSDAMDILQDYAPPFCYVGMSDGDGSDLGVWPDMHAFEEACRDGEVLKVSDSSALDDMAKEDIAAHNYVAIVSDHGNVSLYAINVTLGEEIFSIV
jgi:hypothetical protein